MLDNTKIFESAENKELDGLLKDYQDLTAKQKDIKTSLDRITTRIKEICDKQAGTYEIPSYVFALNVQNRTSINVETLATKYTDIFSKIPYSCLSLKNEELKKDKELWESIPSEVIKITPVLVMGTITKKTNI